MRITEEKGDTEILLSKSTRDLVMSKMIPTNCGLSNTPFTTYLVGRPSSGKSHWIESIMKKQYRVGPGKATCFDSIFVVAPESCQQSYKDSFAEDCDPEKVFDSLTINNLMEIYEGVKETMGRGEGSNEKYFSLLIIDDCATELRNRNIQKLLLTMLRNHRHIHLSVIVASQNYMAIEKNCRDNLKHLVQFNTTNKLEKDRIMKEWVGAYDKYQFEELWAYLFAEPYQFLMCDRKTDQLHKTFNPIFIHEGD